MDSPISGQSYRRKVGDDDIDRRSDRDKDKEKEGERAGDDAEWEEASVEQV